MKCYSHLFFGDVCMRTREWERERVPCAHFSYFFERSWDRAKIETEWMNEWNEWVGVWLSGEKSEIPSECKGWWWWLRVCVCVRATSPNKFRVNVYVRVYFFAFRSFCSVSFVTCCFILNIHLLPMGPTENETFFVFCRHTSTSYHSSF